VRTLRAHIGACFAAVMCITACHGAPPALPPAPPPSPPSPAPLPRSVTSRSYAVLDSGASRVTVFLATTRRAVQSERAGDRFGPDDADSLQFAAVTVNVPPYSSRGTGELPRQGSFSSAFSSAPNAAKEFFVASVIPADSNRFVQRIAADLAITRSRNVLVFVHGFNTSFEDAAIRAAQIAADLNFDGTVVLFSWPSAASVTSYVRDQQAARNAGFHLLRLLRGTLVAALPDHIELLAHSMGSETVAKALSLAPAIDSLPRFDQVVFAAPDLDRRVFGREILPRLDTRATRVTLYASNDDDALRASRAVNGVWRLGLGGDSLVVLKGMDTIDATRVRADALGHTLFGNQAFLADLSSLLAEGKSPSERRLLAVKRGDLVFYRFRGDPR
jgi:esterase/lipase superfamily enzyme